MTRVTFYVLKGSQQSGLNTLCQITGKAARQGNRVFLHATDPSMAAAMNELLWTFDDRSFIAHDLVGQHDDPHDEDTQVLIGEIPPEAFNEVLINLADQVPPIFSRFERVVEIVAGDDQHRTAARERYKFYKDRGYPLETHEI